eukprot:TRINITY_DN8980_c0_g1_i2.p1 TRINITY_DN8980_c0_g1~~TRINITY_DN8980_c0_g1_i2.p1  ORF type:complete len:438 (-),score=151.90 TRINITY_DN8980_c0_g1_i2:13-1188(-)
MEEEVTDANTANKIFSNIQTIQKFNEDMLQELEEKQNSIEGLARIFIQRAAFLKMYIQYVNNFSDSATTLAQSSKKNKRLSRFLEDRKKLPQQGNLDLSDMLIMPVQRCPRYELLLADLSKKLGSDPNRKGEKDLVDEAVSKVKDVNRSINEQSRIAENLNRVWMIQRQFPAMEEVIVEPHRIFQLEATFDRIVDGKKKKAQLFLFNDLLLVGMFPLDVGTLGSSSGALGTLGTLFLNYRIFPLGQVKLDRDSAEIFTISGQRNMMTKKYTFTANQVQVEKWFRELELRIRETKHKSEITGFQGNFNGIIRSRWSSGRGARIIILGVLASLIFIILYSLGLLGAHELVHRIMGNWSYVFIPAYFTVGAVSVAGILLFQKFEKARETKKKTQ